MLRSHHIGVYVSDMEISLQFYLTAFGYELMDRFPHTSSGKDIAFIGRDGRVALELIKPHFPESFERPSAGRIDHLAWQVLDINAEIERLTALRIVFNSTSPLTVLDGRKIAIFHGPDGERLELVELP
ncbi:MAG: VOC family protein [bacterium]|nr:VOC family protein [bacterium]